MFKFPSSEFSILYNDSEPAPFDNVNLSDEDDFPENDREQSQANNVFTNDDNEGDEIDTELDPTPSQ